MQIQGLNYVDISDLFKGYRKALNEFNDGEYPFTWGNNNFSLISRERMINTLEELQDLSSDADVLDELTVVIDKVIALPEGVYVNLEG